MHHVTHVVYLFAYNSEFPTAEDQLVDPCPLKKFDGGLAILHENEEDAVNWLDSVATASLAKKIVTKQS